MTQINIFLASSLEDLREDREALGNYVRKLNDIYLDRDVYFNLFECEQESLAMSILERKQDEYNRKIADAQLFFVIFFNRAGEFTLEEFDVAYKCFKEYGTPAIVTCFKQGDGYEPEQSVLDFMKRLDNELGHYFKIYSHIDSLKLSLLMQIKLLNLDVPIEFDNSQVTVDGHPVLTLDNIPMLLNNNRYQQLKQERIDCEKAYFAAKLACVDPTSDEVFLSAKKRREKAISALHELEQLLLNISLAVESDGSKGTLTTRQRTAYTLMEQGCIEEANSVMDLNDILRDADYNASLIDAGKVNLEHSVQELLQKAAILMTQQNKLKQNYMWHEDLPEEVYSVFDKAISLEETYGLSRKAMREFELLLLNGSYLSDSDDDKRIEQCVSIATRYTEYVEQNGSNEEIAEAYELMGRIDCEAGYEEAEAELKKAIEIRKQLAVENPGRYLFPLSMSYRYLGEYYYDYQDEIYSGGKAEDAYILAIESYNEAEKYGISPRSLMVAQIDMCLYHPIYGDEIDMGKRFLHAKRVAEDMIERDSSDSFAGVVLQQLDSILKSWKFNGAN